MRDQTDTIEQDPQAIAMSALDERGGGDCEGEIRNRTGVQLYPRQEAEKGSDFRHKHNEALPIHYLPVEIFLQIIHYYIRPYLQDSGFNYYRRLIRLTGVCSRWCNVIRDSPSLWNRIHWSDSSKVVEIALQRSSNHPLDVVLHGTGNVRRDQRRISFLTTALDPHKDRWRSVDVSVPTSWMEEVITVLAEPALSLEKLSVTDEDNTSSSREIDLCGGTAPRVTDLTLNGVSIRWDSEVLYDLTVLDLSWISFPSTATILNVLPHSPRLQAVTIYRCTTKSMANPSSLPTQLTHLTSLQLDLGSLDAIEDFLGHINAPVRCSLATSLPADDEIEDFLQRRLLKWMSNWKYSALVPLEGVLLVIDGGDLRVELSTTDLSEPLALAIECSRGFWVEKFRLILPHLIDVLSSWTKDVTTLRLRLGYPPSGCQDFSFKQSIIEQVLRLPPVTSLELSGVEMGSLLYGLRLGDVSSLFRNICALSLTMNAYGLRESLNWICETVQTVRDAIERSPDEPNPRGQVLKLELRVSDSVTSNNAELLAAAVKELEKLVGFGNVSVVQDD